MDAAAGWAEVSTRCLGDDFVFQTCGMPERPDITVYIEALERRVVGRVLERLRVENPFVLRTALPPLSEVEGQRVVGLRRLGKRIAFGFENGRWLVVHLMIAGGCSGRTVRRKPLSGRCWRHFALRTGRSP